MIRTVLPRREMLGALAGTVLMAGGARPSPGAGRVASGPIVIVRGALPGTWQNAIQHAWTATGGDFRISIETGFNCTIPPDLVGLNGSVTLRALPADAGLLDRLATFAAPRLKESNFDFGVIAPGLRGLFTDAQGRPAGFPFAVGEVQFYVNMARLHRLRVQTAGVWTFDRMEVAVEAANAADPTSGSTLVAGIGWSDPNTFAVFVDGLGGGLFGPKASVGASAVARFASFARNARWSPLASRAPGSPATDFAVQGFGGAAANALFAFVPAWNVDNRNMGIWTKAKVGYAVKDVSAQCLAAGMCTLNPLPFPTLPLASRVPAVPAQGLALHPMSKNPLLAIEFIKWLYEPAQQRLLMPFGLPPVIGDPSTVQTWKRVTTRATIPKFNGPGYLDVTQDLPVVGNGYSEYSGGPLVQFCQTLYGGGTVATALPELQNALSEPPGFTNGPGTVVLGCFPA